MPAVQVALNYTPEVLAGVANGLLTVNGSVVRNMAGQIVAHLQEIKLPAKPTFDVSRFAANLKDPKVLAVLGIGILVTIGVTALVANRQKPESESAPTPRGIVTYNDSLSAYLIAINTGNLSADVIDRMIASLDSLQSTIDSGEVAIDASAEQSASLLTVVREYTSKFAEANDFELGDIEEPTSDSPSDSIASLRSYLEIQKIIIDRAA